MDSDDLQAAFDIWFEHLDENAPGRTRSGATLTAVCRHVQKVVSGQLAKTKMRQQADVQNVCQSALVNLCRELRKGEGKAPVTLANPRAYLNRVARNACSDAVRKQSPEWFSMIAKIRYMGSKSKRYKLWEYKDDQVCGPVALAGGAPGLDRSACDELAERLRGQGDMKLLEIEDLVGAILRAAGRPVSLDLVVTIALLCTGTRGGERSLSEEVVEGLNLADTVPAPLPDPERCLLQKEFVFWAWSEVMEFPREQGQVTGLNLEAVTYLSLEAFLSVGAATEADFVQLIAPVRVSDVRSALPLSDAGIAEVLHLLVDRVRDIRGSAKKRFQRGYVARNKGKATPMAESGPLVRLLQRMVRDRP